MREQPGTEGRFVDRVLHLRDSWEEVRTTISIASRHDFSSQFALLCLLYRWTNDAVSGVVSVYGEALGAMLSGPPLVDDASPMFWLSVASAYCMSFSLVAQKRGDDHHWQIDASIASPRDPGGVRRAPSRSGGWTRAQVEDLVLSLLAGFERGRSRARPAGPAAAQVR